MHVFDLVKLASESGGIIEINAAIGDSVFDMAHIVACL